MVDDIFPVKLEQARTSRRGKLLVGPLDLTLEGQGACVVIGPNGSGKTSLLRLLHGTARKTGGRITWARPLPEVRRHQAFVFQRPVMLRRTVEENLAYPLVLRGTPRAEARKQARDWADRVGLAPLLDRQAPVLSGGEQQKLALARALITRPKLLFLDEPCVSLDGRAIREIEEMLQVARREGTRLILATHDMGQARRLADEVLFMLHGFVHERGMAAAFFDHPKTPQASAFMRGDIVE